MKSLSKIVVYKLKFSAHKIKLTLKMQLQKSQKNRCGKNFPIKTKEQIS